MPWLALILAVAAFIALLAAMPWRRPDPNHVFALELLKSLAEAESDQDRNHELCAKPEAPRTDSKRDSAA
jgi:hypothetical protein